MWSRRWLMATSVTDMEGEVESRPMVVSLLVLTTVTGVVDAVSYFGLGRVLAGNMTGNVLFLAFALSGAPGLSVERSSFSLLGFLAGAIVGGRIHLVMTARGSRRRWIWSAVLIEATLLFGAALISMGLSIGLNIERERLLTIIV